MSLLALLIFGNFITIPTVTNTLVVRGDVIENSRETGETIFRIDLNDLNIEPLPSADWSVVELSIAPRAQHFIRRLYKEHEGYCVEVVDFQGNLIKRFDTAVCGVFVDPDGKRMALCKGSHDRNIDRTTSYGTWLYDFETGTEVKIFDNGIHLEWGNFDNALYIGFGGLDDKGYRYDLATGKIADAKLSYGGFSPDGKLRWGYKDAGGIKIFRRESQEIVSDDFELLKSRHHGTPPVWMGNSIIMIPHPSRELEDFLLFVETGKTMKAPGRIVCVTADEQFVYICKPGLVLEKLPMADLEVLYEGKTENANLTEEGSKDAGKNSDSEPR